MCVGERERERERVIKENPEEGRWSLVTDWRLQKKSKFKRTFYRRLKGLEPSGWLLKNKNYTFITAYTSN